MSKKVVLVSHASGRVGYWVLKELQSHPKLDIRAGVEDPATFAHKSLNVNAVLVDPTRPDTLQSAFRDVDVLFIIPPPSVCNVRDYL